MAKTIEINGLRCRCSATVSEKKITYILYPMDALADWIEKAARKNATTIVEISGMDWQNVFSPWPAKGVPKGSPDFKGESPEFLDLLIHTVCPSLEKELGMEADVERTLVGVSMSGLFTLWQWPQTQFFKNIASLSGSFWYENFMDWFDRQDFSDKTGKAFFLLGTQEPKSNVAAFNSVGINTEAIVKHLKALGVNVEFRWVPGNHYQHGIERLDLAMESVSTPNPPGSGEDHMKPL